jgi:hypothetical protein
MATNDGSEYRHKLSALIYRKRQLSSNILLSGTLHEASFCSWCTSSIRYCCREDGWVSCYHRSRVVHVVITNQSTSFMELNTASQEISRLLWNLKVKLHDHKSQLRILILSQMNPIYTLKPFFLKMYFNIILPSVPRSFEWSLHFRLSNQKCVTHFLSPLCHLPVRPSHSWSDHPNNCWRVQIMETFFMIFSPISSQYILLRLKYSPKYRVVKHCWFGFFPSPSFRPIENKW